MDDRCKDINTHCRNFNEADKQIKISWHCMSTKTLSQMGEVGRGRNVEGSGERDDKRYMYIQSRW